MVNEIIKREEVKEPEIVDKKVSARAVPVRRAERKNTLATKQKIQEFVRLVCSGVTHADAYRQAFKSRGRNCSLRAYELLKIPWVNDLYNYTLQKQAQEIANRNGWSMEQAVNTLKEVVNLGMEEMKYKITMPAAVAVTNAVQELNKISGLTGKEMQVAQQMVIIQGEGGLQD